MKNLTHSASRLLLIFLVPSFIIGCASEPVKIDLPLNHPANPESQEAEFIPPPNPFQEDVTSMQPETTPDTMMKHKTHDETGKQHMDHNMEMEEKSLPESEVKKKSGHKESDHQHKEHSQ